MLKHAKTSAAGPASSSELVGGDDWNAAHVVDADGVTIPARPDAPAAPTAGLVLFAKEAAGGVYPACRAPGGAEYLLQPLLGYARVAMVAPQAGLGATTATGMQLSVSGSPLARAQTFTSLVGSMRRLNYSVAINSAGNAVRLSASGPLIGRGGAPGVGGFRVIWRWIPADPVSVTTGGSYGFVGVAAATLSSIPSNNLHLFGVGTDGDEQLFSVFTNDGSGTATKIALGANFPAFGLGVDCYQLTIACAPNSSTMGLELIRMNTGHVARMTLAADLPGATVALLPTLVRANGSSALAIGVDFVSLYAETDY